VTAASGLLVGGVALRGGAAALVWWSMRHHRPAGRAVWHAVAASLAAFAVGDGLALAIGVDGADRPPAAMAAYALGFAALAGALMVVAARRNVWRDAGAVLDGAALVGAGLTLLAQVRLWSGGTGALAAVLPVANVAVVLLVLLLGFSFHEREPAQVRFTAGVALTVAGNLALVVDDGAGGGWTTVAQALWLVAAVSLAAAAWDRSMARFASPVAVAPSELGRSRLSMLATALAATPLTLLLAELTGEHVDVRWLAVTTTATTIVVTARVWRLVAESHALSRQSAAIARIGHLALGGATPGDLVAAADQALSEGMGGRDRAFTEAVSDALGMALAHVRHADGLRFRAHHDNLTGLLNRWGFERRLADVAAARGVGMAVLDLDGFKQVNDLLGHDAGDAVLREVGEILAAAVREQDVVARLGGDEFTVLLPDATEAEADALATRLEALVRVETDGPAVTASVGMAWSAGPVVDCIDLLRQADESMYEAKRRRSGARP
jgi:diguanylate cyclase (GGDEF)-like protein